MQFMVGVGKKLTLTSNISKGLVSRGDRKIQIPSPYIDTDNILDLLYHEHSV